MQNYKSRNRESSNWHNFVRKILIAKYFQMINRIFKICIFFSKNIFVIFRTKQKFFKWNFELVLNNFTLVENRVLQWLANCNYFYCDFYLVLGFSELQCCHRCVFLFSLTIFVSKISIEIAIKNFPQSMP
jgi:hypothetical protein